MRGSGLTSDRWRCHLVLNSTSDGEDDYVRRQIRQCECSDASKQRSSTCVQQDFSGIIRDQ